MFCNDGKVCKELGILHLTQVCTGGLMSTSWATCSGRLTSLLGHALCVFWVSFFPSPRLSWRLFMEEGLREELKVGSNYTALVMYIYIH